MTTYRLNLLIIILAAFISDRAQADDQNPPKEITEIFIFTPYRSEKDHPFTFEDIDAQSFEDTQYGQEPSSLLTKTPAVTAYSDSGSNQGYSYFRLRGIDQTRINMTLDGVPLNEPEDQGVYFSNYPDFFSSIDSLQIVRGVGSSQNGTASYGGSFRFISHKMDTPANQLIGASGGSFETNREFAEYNSGMEGGKGVYLRAANIYSDGYKHHSSNQSQSLFYKAATESENNRWELTGFTGHQANDLAWIGATRDQIDVDRRFNANSSQENDQFTQSLISLQNTRELTTGDDLQTTIYYNHLSGDYDFDLNNFLGLPSTNELYNYHYRSNFYGAFSSYKLNYDLTKITFGLHGNYYEREHRGSERNLGTLYNNTGRKQELSVSTQVERIIDDFILLTDLQTRYTQFNYIGDASLPVQDWTFFNPKLGATYLITNYTNVYYSIGRTGREPTRNDIFAGNDNLSTNPDGSLILGTTQAEYVLDQELGVRTKAQDWSVNANLFLMNFDKEIVLNGKIGPNGLPLTQSVNHSYRSGLELEGNWDINQKFSLHGNFVYNYSQIKYEGEEFTPIITPAVIINQGIRYRQDLFSLGLDLRYQSRSYIDFANSEHLNNFFTADLNTSYQFEHVKLGVIVNNILNEKYFSNGYIDGAGTSRYFVQAPANVFCTLTWEL